MTVKELKDHIRDITKQVNNRIAEYRIQQATAKNPFKDDIFEKGVKQLQRTAGVKARKGEVGFGFRGKVKKTLERQAKRLERFLSDIDTTTETSLKKREKAVERRYEAFVNNTDNPYLSMDDYEQLVDDLGDIGGDILGTFNYSAMIEEYAEIVDSGRSIDLVKVIRNVRNNPNSKGVSRDVFTSMVIDEMRKK